MKVAIASDLHLEFGDLDIDNPEGAEVLILAGDILVANHLRRNDPYGIMDGTRSQRYHDFFQRCSQNFEHVLYVAGNHEHYDGDFVYTHNILRQNFEYLKNVHILERNVFRHKDFVFVGSTLWTDMNRADPMTLQHMKSAMNDFRCVDNSAKKIYRKVPLYKKGEDGQYVRDEKGNYIQDGMKMKEENALFSPQDALEDHYKNVGFITAEYNDMAPWEAMVVIGHHSPSHKSCHPYYAHDQLMNGGYHSNLEGYILDRPGIHLWVHGHTHHDFDYKIGDTCRVVCNPRGYIGHEARAREWKLKVIDL